MESHSNENGVKNPSSDGELKSSYATGEYSQIVQEGYSNGINNGYLTQSVVKKNK